MRIGIIGSSGGAAFIAAREILENNSHANHHFFVIVDRDCGLLQYCLKHHIPVIKISAVTNQEFSTKAAQQLENWGEIHVTLLFFSRLVTHELYANHKLINIHPSLLPNFKGFNAVEKALAAKSHELGATAHLVDESVDGGPIVLQTSFTLTPELWNEPTLANKISYLQKVWLTIFIISFIEQSDAIEAAIEVLFECNDKNRPFPKVNPSLNNQAYLKAFSLLQNKENIRVY